MSVSGLGQQKLISSHKCCLFSIALYIFHLSAAQGKNKIEISGAPFSQLCSAPRTNSSTAYRFLTRETLQRSFTESPPLTAQPQSALSLSLSLSVAHVLALSLLTLTAKASPKQNKLSQQRERAESSRAEEKLTAEGRRRSSPSPSAVKSSAASGTTNWTLPCFVYRGPEE